MAQHALRRRANLGLERVPCVRIEHLSDSEQRVLRLAINRLGETGDWSLEALKIEFEELILADAPIEISGFSLDEIDQIILGDGNEGLEEGPLEPEPPQRFSSRPARALRRWARVGQGKQGHSRAGSSGAAAAVSPAQPEVAAPSARAGAALRRSEVRIPSAPPGSPR